MCLVASQFIHADQERYVATADDWEEFNTSQETELPNDPVVQWVSARLAELREQLEEVCSSGGVMSDIEEEIITELENKISVLKSELKILLG